MARILKVDLQKVLCSRPEAILHVINNNKPRFEIGCDYQAINRMELRVVIVMPSLIGHLLETVLTYTVTALHVQIRSQTYSLTAHTRKELITFSAITIYHELASHRVLP